MALVVEDGTGLTNANAFVSVVDFKAYCDERGHVYSTYTDAVIEQAAVRSTDYLSNSWPWDGFKLKERGNAAGAQALAFPRTNLTDSKGYSVASDSVPIEVVSATCEVMLIEVANPGITTPTYTPHERVKSEGVGPLKVEYDLSRTDADGARPIMLVVKDLIGQFLVSGAGSRLQGASTR